MKYCSRCGAEADDSMLYCPKCGSPFAGVPALNPYDHTAEFNPEDVAASKLYAALCYVTSLVGVIVALLACPDSAFVKFHVREVVKLTIVMFLLGLVMTVLCWTVIIPILGGIFAVVLAVIAVIGFFRACQGKAVELEIVRAFKLFK